MHTTIVDNENTIMLKQFKEKYNLSWKEVSQVLGQKLGNIDNWYQHKFNFPIYYKVLLDIYLENPKLFNKYKNISCTKSVSDNYKAIKNLLELKNKNKLTCKELGVVFGLVQTVIQDWATGCRSMPIAFKILTKIYIDNPRIFKEIHKITTNKV